MRHALLLLLVGCGSTDIDRGVCGNGLVEPGEDCDAADGRCSECGIVCATTQDCLDYDTAGGTAGFVCGPDGFCHAPAGLFERAGDVSLPVTSFRITDADFDGVGDIVAQSQTAVRVLFGDAAGDLATSADMQTPFPQGFATYADLDGDGSLDVLAPTADGIVAYTTPFGVPSPYPFPSFVPENQGRPLFVQPIPVAPPEEHLGIIGLDPSSTNLVYLVMDIQQQPPVQLGAGSLCGATADQFDPDDVDVFVLGNGAELVAVTIARAGQPPALCVLEIQRTGTATYAVAPIAFQPAAPLTGHGVLANLRGQQCPSLIVAQGATPALVEYPPSKATAPCGFAGTPTALAGAPPGSAPIGTVPLVPAATSPNGPLTVGIALTTGIFAFVPGSNSLADPPLYISDRALGAIRFVDLDGDADLDVVAIGQRADDIDLLYRGVDGSPGFTRFRFDTENPIVGFLLGDFDGNEKPDVAYVERAVDTERLEIAYGTADRLLPGVTVGTFLKVLSVIPGNIPDSNDRFSVISDLAVLFDAGTSTQLALLHGSPQRTMLAFFDPRPQPIETGSMFRGVVAGNFSGADGGHNDVLAIEQATTTRLYVSNGANGGELERGAVPSTSTVIGTCGSATDQATQFCLDGAQFIAWPADAAHDIVLGVDANRKVIALDPRLMQPSMEAPIKQFDDTLVAPANTSVRQLQRIELDDGSQRLLVSLGGALDAAVNLCGVDPAAGPSCTDVGAMVTAATVEPVTCVDAVLGRVARAARFEPPASTTSDLVVLCRRMQRPAALFRVSIDGARVEPLIDIGDADQLQVGDVTGDGIADVVLLDRNFAVPVLRVFRQCTSRDVGCGKVAFDPAVGP